jgi:hypothetical protein
MQTAFSPFAGYRPSGELPALAVAGEQTAPAVTAPGSWPAVLNPQNPLFWFAALAATTLGLVAVSGNVRLGRTKVSAAVGS